MGKLDCRGILRVMSDYIDGDLERSVCAEIEEHLTTCRKCRFHVDAIRYTINIYDEWRADDVPPEAVIRLRERLSEETGCLGVLPGGDAVKGTAAEESSRRKPAGKKTAAKASRRRPAAKKAAAKISRRKPAGRK